MKEVFFLRAQWIGRGTMLTGAVGTMYASLNTVRYILYGDIQPLWFGKDAMAFSSSVLFSLYGIALFWMGWNAQHVVSKTYRAGKGMSPAQLLQLSLALTGSVTAIAVAVIGIFKKG